MAGVFGDQINSRADFYRMLAAARQKTAEMLQKMPSDPALQLMQRQVEAITRWTDGGRIPTEDERRSVNFGTVMYREFQGTHDVDEYNTMRLAAQINNYMQYWPDDAHAADPDWTPMLSDGV